MVSMKRIIKNKKAVSEIVGTMLLLGFAIAMFVGVQLMALNFPFNEPDPTVRLSATIDDDTVIVVHLGGESLSPNTEIVYYVEGNSITKTASEMLAVGDTSWNIGEKLSYNLTGSGDFLTLSDLTGKEVRITVIDVATNSLIMQGAVIGDDPV
jgi:hypothetical protein